jgi:hypothetical protein
MRWTRWMPGLLVLAVTLAISPSRTHGQAAPTPKNTPAGSAGSRADRPAPISRSERLRLRGMPTTPVVLITWKAVQEELGLTEAQTAQIKSVGKEFDDRRLNLAQRLAKPEGRLAPEALTEAIASMRSEQEAAIARILGARQRTRLEQISLQVEGPLCVARPEIAERINLSPEQLEMIREIVAQMRAAQDEQWAARLREINAPAVDRPKASGPRKQVAPRPAPDPVELAHQEQVQIEDEGVRQIARVLSRRQRSALNRLMGNPFDLTRLQPGLAKPRVALSAADTPDVLEPVDAPASKSATRGNGVK